MTHLSDFSYLQRIAQEVYLAAFLLIRMWQSNGFRCLSPRRLINGELKSIITWFMFLLLIAQASWDILCTYIKYTEGFMQVGNVIISKPFEYWKTSNQNPIETMNYVQCVTFALQISILLLLQCFWNYLSNVVAKQNFMGSKEFTVYIICTIGSIAMFPVLNYFYKHTALEEVVPQTAYSCEILLVALLGFRNHARFNRLIKATIENGKKTDTHVVDRLTYFRDMNLLLNVALIAFGGGMLILCIDGFTTNKIINSNKFAADLLICNTNISSIFLWLIIIGIFHPARMAIDSKKKTTDRTSTTDDTPRTATAAITTDRHDVSKLGSLPAGRCGYGNNKSNNNKKEYDMDSTKVLTKESDSELELGYMSSSPPESINNIPTGPTGGLSHPRHYYQQQRSNVVSIDDPFAHEQISFSMVNSSKYDSNAMVYASAVDNHHAPNPYHLSSSTAPAPPPPFSSSLPPPPQSPTSSSNYSSSFMGLRSAATSPPPNQELPPIPSTTSPAENITSSTTTTTVFGNQDASVPWLDRSTSPGRR